MSYRPDRIGLALLLATLTGCQEGPAARTASSPEPSPPALLASYQLSPTPPPAARSHTAPFVPLLPANPAAPPSTHVALLVSLNDGPPHPFILDTGTPVTAVVVSRRLLSLPAVARRLDAATPARIHGIAGKSPAYEMRARSIAVGPCRLTPFPYLLIPSDRDPAGTLGQTPAGPVVGVLGNDFLSRFRLTIDYQRQTVTLDSR